MEWLRVILKSRITKQIALLILAFALGYESRILLWRHVLRDEPRQNQIIRENGDFTYISPLLFCGISENVEYAEFKPLEKEIEKYIAENREKATQVAVYFRDINAGRWMGVNENEKFSPASLLKVPTAIAYYRLAQKYPKVLQKTYINGARDFNKEENFRTSTPLQARTAYTVRELLEAMIIRSDNNAARLLADNIDQNLLADTYTDLGLSLPEDKNLAGDFLSAKKYAYFFRVLYNATYLSREYSERALDLLAEGDFKEGLRGGIPKEIPIAGKFGERTFRSVSGDVLGRELHDCGIVYAPNAPFLICVMTKGQDFAKLSEVIGGISRIVYTSAVSSSVAER